YGVFSYSNHDSFIDSFPINSSMMDFRDMIFNQGRIPYNVPDFGNFYNNKIGASLMRLLRNIPIERNTGDTKIKNDFVNKSCQILKKNNLHLFFEGGRTIDEIRPCVSGVAEIILNLLEENFDLIIVPIFIDGMKKVMPREIGQNYFKISCHRHKVKVIFGKPIDFSEILDKDFSREKKINKIKKKVRDSVIVL
ncbi:hypothetical protein KKA39_02675, partial [Patescibacteria group bacterium]|nr:hypothetical protein [Patescibacteria group bacterium]MBU1728181.1 hypothetical protein [Patescibacteria group bacterium]